MDEREYIIENITKEEWEILEDNGIDWCPDDMFRINKDAIIFGEGEYNKAMELLKRKQKQDLVGRKVNYMSLREYLKAIKIDEIEDDREFCEEEYNVVHDYCDGQKYCLSEDDKNVINERGLQDSFSVWKWNYIIELWREFGDIPMNPDTECIEEEWNDFSIGTHREEIWHWFEETFNISVGKDLMGL